jgi:methylenetetrahydrofolate reductase (NADPH)
MFDTFFNRFRGSAAAETDEQRAHRLALIEGLTFEVIPIKSLDTAIKALPPGSSVSVTASPAKGLSATQEITENLLAAGHHAIPHISARMVVDKAHTAQLAAWTRSAGVSTMFLVGGDIEEPGEYFDAVAFLRDLLDTDHGLSTIGVTAYPDSHPLISDEALHEALHAKQALLAEAGVAGYCSTQMCFDADLIVRWLRAEREAGMTLPVHLGLAGVVDRARLLRMGVRLGIGQSLSYLRKNRSAITAMMTKASYDPNDLLKPLSPALSELGVAGLHVFTFNQVEETATWRARLIP